MRGLIAATALLAGVQAAVDPIVIKVRCSTTAAGVMQGPNRNAGLKVFLQEQWHPVLHEGCCLPAGSQLEHHIDRL